MNQGIQNDAVIDEIAFDPDNEEIVLIMRAEEKWDEAQERVDEMKGKLETYVAFAFGGELKEQFPEHVDKKVRFQLDCVYMPPEPVMEFLEEVHEILEKQGARLLINHIDPGATA